MIDWFKLVQERNAWVARNFPPVEGEIPGQDSILGCIEELGELAHAHLKLKQGIRGTKAEHDEAAKDAIGDLVVYLLGVISYEGIADRIEYEHLLENIDESFGRELALFALASEVGRLSGYIPPGGARAVQETMVFRVEQVLALCHVYCSYRYWDFEDIVTKTWDHVKQRDWNAHREEGAPREDPKMKDPDPLERPGLPPILPYRDPFGR